VEFTLSETVGSLGLVSPGAATDVVALFFLEKKLDDLLVIALWKVMNFFAVVSSPLPSPSVVYPVCSFKINSASKNNFSPVSPLDGVTPSDATGQKIKQICRLYVKVKR